jgi:hypothetical protein
MNRLEQDESEVLARARRAFSPTPNDVGRVRASLRAVLAAGPPAAAPDPITTGARVARVAAHVLVVGVVAASSAGIGYRAGRRAAVSEPRAPQSAPSAPEINVDPPAAAPATRGLPPAAAAESARATRTVASASHHARAPETPPAPSPDADSLAREIEALRAVERALRDGRPGFALALLREMDRTLPQGKLIEERRATEAIARCASGAVPLGLDLADEFASDYPHSVYRERVAEACAKTDPGAAGDTATRRQQP